MTTDTRAILKAAAIAAEAHAGQNRKHGLGPYIQHPFKVAGMVVAAGLPTHVIQAALLHDVLEDCENTDHWRAEIALLGEDVLALVVALTKSWSDHDAAGAMAGKPEYYRRIATTGYAADLKLLDRTDNLNDMLRLWPTADASQKRWIVKYLNKTRPEIVPLMDYATSPVVKRLFNANLLALTALVEAAA